MTKPSNENLKFVFELLQELQACGRGTISTHEISWLAKKKSKHLDKQTVRNALYFFEEQRLVKFDHRMQVWRLLNIPAVSELRRYALPKSPLEIVQEMIERDLVEQTRIYGDK